MALQRAPKNMPLDFIRYLTTEGLALPYFCRKVVKDGLGNSTRG